MKVEMEYFMKRYVALAFSTILLGCQTTQDQTDPMLWGRVDCKRSGDPKVAIQFEQDKAICSGRAQASAIAGSAPMPAFGLAGALARGIAHDNISNATTTSCMAERGYLWKRKSEHDALCSAVSRR